jgi:hypothetical protein
MAEFNEASFKSQFISEFSNRFAAAIVGIVEDIDASQERDLGFDAMLKIELGAAVVPVFFQFKAPHVQRMESKDGDCWSYFGGVHYRFPLREDRRAKKDTTLPLYRQHNLLVILRRRYIVMYVSPLFHSKADLATFRVSGAVQARSLYVDPAEIGPIYDRDGHHVSYSMTGTAWAFHSEFQAKGSPKTWADFGGEASGAPFSLDPGSFRELAQDLRSTVETEYGELGDAHDEEPEPESRGPEQTLAEVRATAELLDARFGATMALVPVTPWGSPASRQWPWPWPWQPPFI